MKKNLFFLLATGVILFCQSCNAGPGFKKLSGEIISEERKTEHFNAIDVSTGIDLVLTQGNEEKVIVKADKDILDQIKTEVEGGELKIYCTKSLWHIGNIIVEVTLVELDHLNASAGSDVKSTGTINVNSLILEVSSGSDLKLDIEGKSIDLSASSGSDARLDGNTGQLFLKASSGSDINTDDLEADEVSVKCSSGSDIHVNSKSSIEVDASGGSDVYVTGKPEKQDISTSGGSDVYFR